MQKELEVKATETAKTQASAAKGSARRKKEIENQLKFHEQYTAKLSFLRMAHAKCAALETSLKDCR